MERQVEKNRRKLALAMMPGLFIFSFQFVAASSISVESVVDLVNQARIKESLDPLVVNDKLNKAARDKATDMLAHGYFAHTSLQGVTLWDWINKNNYKYGAGRVQFL